MKSTFLADLHVHTNFSDGKLSVSEVVDLFGLQGFGAIAITDHICERRTFLGKAAVALDRTLHPKIFDLYMDTVLAEAERAWRKYRMLVIPGFELTKNTISNSRSAHVLGLGVTKFVSADQDATDLTREIRRQNGLTIAAHPVWTRRWEKQTYYLWDRRQELADEFDAWEVASGPHIFKEVLSSDLPKVASSDLHTRWQLNSWKTVFHCEKTQEDIFEAIRRQNLHFNFFKEVRHFDYCKWLNQLTLPKGQYAMKRI